MAEFQAIKVVLVFICSIQWSGFLLDWIGLYVGYWVCIFRRVFFLTGKNSGLVMDLRFVPLQRLLKICSLFGQFAAQWVTVIRSRLLSPHLGKFTSIIGWLFQLFSFFVLCFSWPKINYYLSQIKSPVWLLPVVRIHLSKHDQHWRTILVYYCRFGSWQYKTCLVCLDLRKLIQ